MNIRKALLFIICILAVISITCRKDVDNRERKSIVFTLEEVKAQFLKKKIEKKLVYLVNDTITAQWAPVWTNNSFFKEEYIYSSSTGI
ncbi:hypothetical protein [Pararcticibacter amylolyticus]|uniref:Uncharacterized protein n=1 Tax=Pararcticibacter amylolyticus TaxID=2173175 RepID=A0A2U2PH74_9SPHI|nr:hypothetical protein [Pararcticibacter amylolyticus]PWG80746.1 hypothetical protein DDR33_09800 [Pararcticibacter amylolyticus]